MLDRNQIPKHRGFLHHERKDLIHRKVSERIRDFKEVSVLLSDDEMSSQAARCMDCGVPFCQSACPVGNVIPDWNDLVLRQEWESAYKNLARTNNFPEFTGRICPAPCESACVLSLNDQAVSIENIERSIIEKAFEDGFVSARVPQISTGKTVAVVGSGPAGLATADQLNQAGHEVVVFERHRQIGGLLRYGIPDFKLEKWVIDRRVDLLKQEGIEFKTEVQIGVDVLIEELDRQFDAVVFCCGATQARDLGIPGRDFEGVHFAWDFLALQNRKVSGEIDQIDETYLASNKDVIVIGGGDTGSDCIGTSVRQNAKSVTQFEVMPTPPSERSDQQPWPYYPMIMKVSSSHEEGAERHWSVMTKSFLGDGSKLVGLETVKVERDESGRFCEIPGSIQKWKADMVLLAIGYTGPESALLEKIGIDRPAKHRTSFDEFNIGSPKYFSAGDMRRGQSLVVWAVREGREVAQRVDNFLMDRKMLSAIGNEDMPRI